MLIGQSATRVCWKDGSSAPIVISADNYFTVGRQQETTQWWSKCWFQEQWENRVSVGPVCVRGGRHKLCRLRFLVGCNMTKQFPTRCSQLKIQKWKMTDIKRRWKCCVSASSFSFFSWCPVQYENCCFSGFFAVIRVGSCNRWQSNWVKWNINSGTQSGRCTGHVELQSINITEAGSRRSLLAWLL